MCGLSIVEIEVVSPTQLQYVSPGAEEFDTLQRQMKARIEEGQGETIYEIGVGGII